MKIYKHIGSTLTSLLVAGTSCLSAIAEPVWNHGRVRSILEPDSHEKNTLIELITAYDTVDWRRQKLISVGCSRYTPDIWTAHTSSIEIDTPDECIKGWCLLPTLSGPKFSFKHDLKYKIVRGFIWDQLDFLDDEGHEYKYTISCRSQKSAPSKSWLQAVVNHLLIPPSKGPRCLTKKQKDADRWINSTYDTFYMLDIESPQERLLGAQGIIWTPSALSDLADKKPISYAVDGDKLMVKDQQGKVYILQLVSAQKIIKILGQTRYEDEKINSAEKQNRTI